MTLWHGNGGWWFPLTEVQLCEVWCFICCKPAQAIEKQCSCRLFETPWRSCHVTVIDARRLKSRGFNHVQSCSFSPITKPLLSITTNTANTDVFWTRSPGTNFIEPIFHFAKMHVKMTFSKVYRFVHVTHASQDSTGRHQLACIWHENISGPLSPKW